MKYPSFPFRTFRTVGTFLVLLGVLIAAAGIFDVTWSVIKYTNQYETCDNTNFLAAGLEDPCDNDELNWTWASSGIWGGVIVILVGIVGVMFSRFRTRRLKFRRDMFAVTSFLLVIPVCPAVIAVSVLQLYYQNGVFYKWVDNSFDTEDPAKLVAPIAVAGLALLAWFFAAVGSGVACCCADADEEAPTKYRPPPPQGFQPPPMMPPANQPKVEIVGILPPYGPPPPPGMFGPPPPPAISYPGYY